MHICMRILSGFGRLADGLGLDVRTFPFGFGSDVRIPFGIGRQADRPGLDGRAL